MPATPAHNLVVLLPHPLTFVQKPFVYQMKMEQEPSNISVSGNIDATIQSYTSFVIFNFLLKFEW